MKTLAGLGARIEQLERCDRYPDAVFIEDCAVATDEVVVITRPGIESRRGEEEAVAEAIGDRRVIARIEPPGTMDGGDVMRIGRTFHVGISGRTNRSGYDQLGAALARYGYSVAPAEPRGCLHLKSACTFAGHRVLLYNPDWIDGRTFAGVEPVAVSPREPWGANTLTVAGITICSASYPETNEILRRRGLKVRVIDVSEFHKAEGALTCMSLLLNLS